MVRYQFYNLRGAQIITMLNYKYIAVQDLVKVTDFNTGKSFEVNRLALMDMEEVQKAKKHYYTRLKEYGALGGKEYKVKEKICEINSRNLRL